jgi:hypothetical protein
MSRPVDAPRDMEAERQADAQRDRANAQHDGSSGSVVHAGEAIHGRGGFRKRAFTGVRLQGARRSLAASLALWLRQRQEAGPCDAA